jgi:hypothetical protein
MLKKLKSPRRLAALAIFAIIAASAFGFAAANTFPGPDRAGTGTDTVSGYAVSNIHYTIDSTDATKFSDVSFTLNNNAGSAVAYVGANNSQACTGGPLNWSCHFATSPDIGASFNSLGVTAAQ